jgi:hypothetical protein
MTGDGPKLSPVCDLGDYELLRLANLLSTIRTFSNGAVPDGCSLLLVLAFWGEAIFLTATREGFCWT